MSCNRNIVQIFHIILQISFSLIDGVALGGGSEIAVYPDYLLITENTRLGFIHGKMGIITAWGGGSRSVVNLYQSR